MIVDFDDYCEANHRLDLLSFLHDTNPLFRCTLFAIPALGSQAFWDATPDWCELAVHGYEHPHPRECENWTADRMRQAIAEKPPRFVEGWKSPGWQISDGTYEALVEAGWWCADHYENNERRPDGLRVHVLDQGDHWHGHVQDTCGNGLRERFPELVERIRKTETFELISEVVAPWQSRVAV